MLFRSHGPEWRDRLGRLSRLQAGVEQLDLVRHPHHAGERVEPGRVPALVRRHRIRRPGDPVEHDEGRPPGGRLLRLAVDGKDPEVAKYALALINKHIDAEGGPDKIDVELVVHGPALELFEKDKMDPEMTKRFDQAIQNGVKAEMCQVSMKFFGKTIDNLAKGFVATLHPVAVKRIADLQQQGYLYIKP